MLTTQGPYLFVEGLHNKAEKKGFFVLIKNTGTEFWSLTQEMCLEELLLPYYCIAESYKYRGRSLDW